nr:RNA-directed DNA polymerase, eukaryota [Tanacetum cinerariifolium]
MFDSFKMVYRGMTCWVRAIEVPGWVPDFEEDGEEGYDVNDGSHEDDMYGGVSKNLKDVEGESDREEVHETNFEEAPEKIIFEGNSVRQNDVHFENPFGIYEVLNKKRDGKNIDDKHEDILKYPPGFTPNEEGDVYVEKVDKWSDENRVNNGQEDGVCVGQHVNDRVEVSNDTHESTCSGHFKKSEVPRKGESILEMINDLVNDYLSFVIGNWDGEVVIMGDFNEVRGISKRFGSIFNKYGAEAFNSFIVNAGLVEVPLGGCSFTCISSTYLDRFLSDHRPIIMREAHYDYGPIPFKFFHYWFELDGFDKLVEQTCLEGNARLHKESLNSRKSILKAELADLDGVIDKGEGSDADGHQRREVVRLIQEVEKVDAMKVAQKAKIKWSIEGDENSKYYHGVLNKKRGRLTIRGVLVDGMWMESPHLVKHEFFEHFKNRFEKPDKSRILLERDFVKRISLDQNDDLEREVSNEEIKRAVWDCGIDRAPRPDGFTFGFYRWYWDIIGNDVVDAVKPISLIGSLYKVIARVLANRLVTVLDDIVDEIQSAFVTDRQILDGPFILNEIVHWCKNKKKQSMIFKVDFEKSYDSVRWDFIDDILRRFSFGEKWCKINMNKSNLMGISVDSNKVKHAAAKIVGSGDFSVSSVIKLIDNAILPKGISKTRWIKEVPIKINVHAWKVIHDCLPTRFNISRRSIEIESILCPMCECSVESSRHLFFSCKMISDVVRKITRWWDLEYREINSFEDWCQWISSIRLPMK